VNHRPRGSAEAMESAQVAHVAGAASGYRMMEHRIRGLKPGVQYEVTVERVADGVATPFGNASDTLGLALERGLTRGLTPLVQEEACPPPWFRPVIDQPVLARWLWDYERGDAEERQRLLNAATTDNWTWEDYEAGRRLGVYVDLSTGRLAVLVRFEDEASARAGADWMRQHGGTARIVDRWGATVRAGDIPLPQLGGLAGLTGVVEVSAMPAFRAPIQPGASQ